MSDTTIPIPVEWHDCPDCTYFRSSDVRPYVEDGTLHAYDGRGTSRSSWGAPTVDTELAMLGPDIVAATVTGWHKHTRSPVGGTYYFAREGEQWVRRTANHRTVKAALAAVAA
ncbi:MAG: hypothetical protein H6733_10105 [Alphaproteobacteria bacterium]|nr:hypothetical protein [Alphaproteobacteria bacterium]